MSRTSASSTSDARGRRCHVIDPFSLHVLRQHDVIEKPALDEIVEEIVPGQSGRMGVAVGTGVALALVLGFGQFLYHRLKGNWSGLDWPSVVIWSLQLGFCFGLAIFIWREGRAAGRRRALAVLLAHRRCPHCGFDLGGSPVDASDGATVCPECGTAWRLPDTTAVVPTAEASLSPTRKIVLVGALSVIAMFLLIVFVLRTLT